jgi:hypothetical protein
MLTTYILQIDGILYKFKLSTVLYLFTVSQYLFCIAPMHTIMKHCYFTAILITIINVSRGGFHV